MSKKYQALICPIRYMPDPIKRESINLGVLLLDQASGFAQARFTHNERRLRCLDPNIDLEMIRSFEADFQERLAAGFAFEANFLDDFTTFAPDSMQFSIDSGIATNDLNETLLELANRYLKARVRPENDPVRGSKGIRQSMRNAIEGDELLKQVFQWKIPVSEYVKDDPLLIDCGYEAGGFFKMFHAVPLGASPRNIKELAFSYPRYCDGFKRNRSFKPQLTAVLPDESPAERKAFAENVFDDCKIGQCTVSEFPSLARQARKELGLEN